MRSKFSSIAYELMLIALVVGYLFYNLYILFKTGLLLSLIPITVQLTLLYFIITKHKYLSWGIKIWALFFIVAGGMGILSVALGEITNDANPESIIWKFVKLIVGIILYIIASREVEVIYLSDDLVE